jgi:hypothetical protein
VQWAQAHLDWQDEWNSVVFSDEKKFRLDGPDGNMYYYHDKRKPELLKDKWHSGGGGVMVWLRYSRARGSVSASQQAVSLQKLTSKFWKRSIFYGMPRFVLMNTYSSRIMPPSTPHSPPWPGWKTTT